MFKVFEIGRNHVRVLFEYDHYCFIYLTFQVKCCKENGVRLIERKEDGRSGREFVHCIAEAVREKCAVVLASGYFMSILSDGSQARKTGREKELVLVRTERSGVPVYVVASLLEVARFGGGDACSIVAGIESIFRDDNSALLMDQESFTKKVVSCTADGASVNFGKYKGVLTQMKDQGRPWMLMIHCANHRIELAVKEAFNINKLNEVDQFYTTNFYLLRNSGKLKSEVAECAKALGITYYNISKITGTRFVGHRRRGFQNILESWPAYITAYENYIADDKGSNATTKAKVSGLLKKFKSYEFLLTIATYLDMLEMVVPVSKIFESNDLLPYSVNSIIDQTTSELNENIDEIGGDLEFLDSYVGRYSVSTKAGDQNWLSGALEGQFIKAGEKRKKDKTFVTVKFQTNKINQDHAIDVVRALKKKLCESLIKVLKKRFCDYKRDKELYTSMRFIDMEYWESDRDYGNREIILLHNHFAKPLVYAGFDLNRSLVEWKKFKIHAATHYNKMAVRDMWKSVLTYKRESFPNVSLLVSLILSISGSNSSVERCFSTVTSILSDRRLSMAHDTLEDTLIISGNDNLWSPQEREEIIERARVLYMAKRRRLKLNTSEPNRIDNITDDDRSDNDSCSSDESWDSEDDLYL